MPKVEKEHSGICLLQATIRLNFCLKLKPFVELSVSRGLLGTFYTYFELVNLKTNKRMKKKFTLVLSALLMAGLVYDYNYRMVHSNSSGAPAGHTGSPSDGQTCARVGCHAGGPSQSNETVELTSNIPVDGYVGGTTYDMTLTMTKTGGVKFGFQLAAQNTQGNALGTIVAGTGSQTVGNGYLTHSFNGTSVSGGTKSWNFQWTAPTSGTGTVTVYVAGNFTNNNGSTNGDVIVPSSFTISEASGVGISEAELAALSVYPNPVIDEINIAAKDVDEEIMVTLYNMEGKKVIEQSFEPGDITIDVASKSLNTGIYFLTMESGGNTTTKKLLIK
ncbi:MAG: T9SS type A sorting domain-containing protein [Flavobacteriales bacterium]|nr:T9SS type A sorting domain-containing protein [Flavobacteriales bacterium]